jgi:hypothetical protein
MKYAGTTIVIVLTVTLAVAVGWVVFHVGRVVICIIRDARAARQPPRRLQHPEFGTLTFESGLWSGQIQRDGREVHFFVAGTDATPDAGLLSCVHSLLARFRETERIAMEFLRIREPELRQAKLDFDSFSFLWEDKPDDFAFEFLADGDDSRAWRVEFVAGQPNQTGFDD